MDKTGVEMQIADKIENLLRRFNQYSQWEDKYKELIKLGKELAPMDDSDKLERFRIKGCQSQVWLKPKFQNGKLFLAADSDAIIVKGIIGLLIEVYNGEDPATILNHPAEFLKDIGITEHLTMNRTNGLASMIKQIQLYTTAFMALKEKGINDADL